MVVLLPVTCSCCSKFFLRASRRIVESKKFKWKVFCSPKCLADSRKNGKYLICDNPKCSKKFYRAHKDISQHNFCSRSCAISINNSKFPKNPGIRRKCAYCGKEFVSRKKYCSSACHSNRQFIGKEELLKRIKKFYKENGRIPIKSEFPNSRAARNTFGAWNNAIKAAGFIPNPVMFAKKYIANDGHKCDSLAEKIIDDWLYLRKIQHKRSVPYPGGLGFTADFVIGNYWIEFFGLHGQHRRYDELRKGKLQLARKYRLGLIGIYPKHLFPRNRLDQELANVIES